MDKRSLVLKDDELGRVRTQRERRASEPAARRQAALLATLIQALAHSSKMPGILYQAFYMLTEPAADRLHCPKNTQIVEHQFSKGMDPLIGIKAKTGPYVGARSWSGGRRRVIGT